MVLSFLLLSGYIAVQTVAPAAPMGQVLCQADAEHLALSRNRELVAVRLGVQEAMVEAVTAALWPNPEASYSLGNFILGEANPQDQGLRPGRLSQLQHSVQLSQTLDLWFKRRGHRKLARWGVMAARLEVEDAVRTLRHRVRSQFAQVLREQDECRLATDMRRRYDRTVGLSIKRFLAGEISRTEQDKIILEKLKYVNEEIDARTELEIARQELAQLLGFSSQEALAAQLQDSPAMPQSRDANALLELAVAVRPDLQVANLQRERARAAQQAAQRDAWVDPQLALSYTRSYFQISGDNPHALGLSLSLPLPLFSRNQDGIRAAQVQQMQADNAQELLLLAVASEVRSAVAQVGRSRAMLDVYEGEMLGRAEAAMSVAERSYHAGATNYLELLEAQRTFLQTRASFLRTQYDWRQALIDVNYAVGSDS